MGQELHITLGCFGRTDDGFTSCSGISNIILHLSPSNPNYLEIMDYLDTMQLFDRVMLDYNATRHFVFKMQDKFKTVTNKLWTEKMFLLYQKFVIDHKNCGIFIDLKLSDDQQTNETE